MKTTCNLTRLRNYFTKQSKTTLWHQHIGKPSETPFLPQEDLSFDGDNNVNGFFEHTTKHGMTISK